LTVLGFAGLQVIAENSQGASFDILTAGAKLGFVCVEGANVVDDWINLLILPDVGDVLPEDFGEAGTMAIIGSGGEEALRDPKLQGGVGRVYRCGVHSGLVSFSMPVLVRRWLR
jgi:hypothetical protein